MNKLNIANIAKGALLERADGEIESVLKNIVDRNTDWKKARKVTIELIFEAKDEERDTIDIGIKTKCALAPYRPVVTQVYVDKDADNGVVAVEYQKGTLPGQTTIVDSETGEVLNEQPEPTSRKIVNINR